MIPHGDRGDRAQSRRVEHHEARPGNDDHVVRVLVLYDDVDNLAAAPPDDILECPERRHDMPLRRIDCTYRSQRVHHAGL